MAHRAQRWLREHERDAKGRGFRATGLKYPHLCSFGSMLPKLLGREIRLVNVVRPLEDSVKSLIDREGGKHEERYRLLQEMLWERKRELLDSHEHVDVEYYALLERPADVAAALAERLGLTVTREAVDHVKPAMRTV
jgi:hypothetical protein